MGQLLVIRTVPARFTSPETYRACVAFRYNLLFFVSGGGKFNYQGTKRWLEDNLDHTGAAQSRVVCFWSDRLNDLVLRRLQPAAGQRCLRVVSGHSRQRRRPAPPRVQTSQRRNSSALSA